MTLQQLQQDFFIRLGEASDTLAAALMSGINSNVPLVSSTMAATGWINDAQNDLARNYYPISNVATYIWPDGQAKTPYSEFVCVENAGNVPFGVRKVNFGGVRGFNTGNTLVSAGRAATENFFPNMDLDPLGDPQYFYEDGIEGIGIYPVPDTTALVTAQAIVTPAPLVGLNDIPVFPADRHVLLTWYAIGMCLMRNTEDPALESRGTAYMNAYRDGASKILNRLWRIDADFAADLMADNPAQMVPQEQSQQ